MTGPTIIGFPEWLVPVCVVLGSVLLIAGIIRFSINITKGGHEPTIAPGLVGFGLVIASTPWLLPRLVTMFYELLVALSLDTDSGPDSESEPAPAPEPSEPLDLTMPLTVLIIAASIAILSGVGYGVYRVASSSRSERKESKRLREEAAERWSTVKDLHSDTLATVASYELDVAKAIDYPAFNDITVPEVSAMSKAMRRARDIELQTETDSDIGGSEKLLNTYRNAVDEFVTAVEIAEAKARKIRWRSIPTDEQKDLQLAKELLVQAEDPGNPEAMRHSLYQRLKTVIDRINENHGSKLVPAGTIGQIEEQTRLMIESRGTRDGANNAAATAAASVII